MARILHLISHLEEGGSQRQLAYAIAFNRTQDLEIASLIGSPREKLFPFFQEGGTPIHFLSNRSDFYAPEILPALKTLLRERKYSLIHCWLFQSIVQGLLAARHAGIPCIGSPRSMLETLVMDSSKAWERFLIRRSLLNLDLTIFPSYSVALDFLYAGWTDMTRARVIQNGVDIDHFAPQAEEGTAIVALGRHSPVKGFEDFEWIAQQLKPDFPQLEFVVAGGEPRPGSNVNYIGYVDDVRDVLKRAVIYLSTSISEGMSNAILEAQSMGIPVIGRQLGSLSEVVNHGVTGILTGTREELLAACRMLLLHPEIRKEMGKKARANIVSRFSISSGMKNIEALYSELL